jgi:hypothetical protein
MQLFFYKAPFRSYQKIFALTYKRVYTLMANLFQILNEFVMLFRKNVIEKRFINWRVFQLVKINTRISDTHCILFNEFVCKLGSLWQWPTSAKKSPIYTRTS